MYCFKELFVIDIVILFFVVVCFLYLFVIEMFGLVGGFKGFWIDQEYVGVMVE